MMKALARVCCILVILPSILDGRVLADTIDSGSSRTSLRQTQHGNQRRLFAWGNLLYALHICKDASGWCPDPRCDGPLKPPSCKNGSGGGSSGGSSSSSSSSSGSDRSDSSGASSYSGGDGEASYVNYQYNEAQVEGDSSGEADYGEARVSDGVTNVSTSTTARSRFNMFWAFASLAAVGTLIGIFLLKKNKKKSEEDELDHQLTQSVSKRLEKLLEGKTVHAIHDDGVGPSFLEVGSKGSPVLAASLAKKKRSKKEKKTYEEPDEEAIEMRWDGDDASSYVQMTNTKSTETKPPKKPKTPEKADEAVEMKLNDDSSYYQI